MIQAYWLRWRFEFSDGKVPRYGLWMSAGSGPRDWAWCVDKTNLKWAMIEAKHLQTRTVSKLVVCPGPDFVNFEWNAAAPVKAFGGGAQKVTGQIIGLNLLSRYDKTCVTMDGNITKRKRTEVEQAQNLAGFGR